MAEGDGVLELEVAEQPAVVRHRPKATVINKVSQRINGVAFLSTIATLQF